MDSATSFHLQHINLGFPSTGGSVPSRAGFLEGFYVGDLSEVGYNMNSSWAPAYGWLPKLVLLHSHGHGLSCFAAARRRPRLCVITWVNGAS